MSRGHSPTRISRSVHTRGPRPPAASSPNGTGRPPPAKASVQPGQRAPLMANTSSSYVQL
eukprot:11071240-Lingulodinium_polyedra.AAC.1